MLSTGHHFELDMAAEGRHLRASLERTEQESFETSGVGHHFIPPVKDQPLCSKHAGVTGPERVLEGAQLCNLVVRDFIWEGGKAWL